MVNPFQNGKINKNYTFMRKQMDGLNFSCQMNTIFIIMGSFIFPFLKYCTNDTDCKLKSLTLAKSAQSKFHTTYQLTKEECYSVSGER